MSIPILSDLREPPVIGRFYMVPAVHFVWLDVEAEWPVLGPLHTDVEVLNFAKPHYHVDARFVSKRLLGRVSTTHGISGDAQRYPLAQRNTFRAIDIPRHRPKLSKFRCRTDRFPYQHADKKTIIQLRELYGEPDAVRLPDGRLLCPHRKVDLSQFAADPDGLVTCPLHGLRIRCTASADTRRMAETGTGSGRSPSGAVPKADAHA